MKYKYLFFRYKNYKLNDQFVNKNFNSKNDTVKYILSKLIG